MRTICQITWTRFHHFNLAAELDELGLLNTIFTTLPPWRFAAESVNRTRICSNFWIEGLRQFARLGHFFPAELDVHLAEWHTRSYRQWAANKLPKCEALIALSGSGLSAGRKVQSFGGIYICDRGSTHSRFQNNLLREEYCRWKVPFPPFSEFLIENEEEEYATADAITVPSNFTKDSFIAQGVPAKKIYVAPYGINLNEFHQTGEPPANGIFRILFVGQFSLRKGAPYLLDAFAKFRHPKKELIIVGSIPKELRSILAKFSDQPIRLVGTLPRTEVRNYMSTAHVLVLPSIEEGLALVQAQALACGLPVIATTNTGSTDLFTDGVEGWIVEPRSSTAIADAFSRAASDTSTLNEMRESAIARSVSIGGWRSYALSIISLIKTLQHQE